MQDLFPVPSCFSSGEKLSQDVLPAAATAAGSRQSMVVSVYRSRVAGHCRLVTVTWCKNLLAHGLSVSVDGPDTDSSSSSSRRNSADAANKQQQHSCKVQISPWQPWRKQGSNRFQIGGETVEVFWDLHSAKFCNEPEPQSDYYVAVVSEGEVVLLLGDLRKEAYRRTSSRPSLIEAVLVARKEHVFGKKRFATRSRFHDKGSRHEISVECSNGGGGNMDLDMEIKIDGDVAIHVKHLQWKFRGNDSILIDKRRVEVYWDVHGWLFASGLRYALFIFKPESLSSAGGGGVGDSCCLFLHAWKLD